MIAEQLQCALVERAANEIDAAWVEGIRKSWKKVIQPVLDIAKRVPHGETKIDLDKVQKTAEESLAVLKRVVDYLRVLRQDLLFNKGMWTTRLVAKGEAKKDLAAKAVRELDIAESAIETNIDRVEHWKDVMTLGTWKHEADKGRMLQNASTDPKEFNMMLNSVCPTGPEDKHEGIGVADQAISRRLLKLLNEKAKTMGGTIGLDPIEPDVVHVGRMAVVFQDTPAWKSPARLSQTAFQRGDWRHPGQRSEFLKFFKLVQAMLQKHNLGHLWYGETFVLPKGSAPENPYGKEWGVGGSYLRSKDAINIYDNPSPRLPNLVVHELAHRYWFKFMSAQEQANFGKWFSVVPATSKYGMINSVEDFAEVFADYVMGGAGLGRDQVARLKTFFGRKRKLEHVSDRLYLAMTEAKEEVDRIYREEALEYFKLLSDYVKKNEKKIQVKNRRHEAFGGYLITPQNLRTHRTYPDLYIVLAHQGQMAGIGHTEMGTLRFIVLPVLIAPFDTKYLANRITGAKKIFVHEFIHYLDQHRYKGQVPESGAMLRKKAFGAYYNSPAEFNAFYQEGAGEVLDTVRSIRKYAEQAKPGTLATFVGDYATFEKRFLKPPYFNKDFLDSLNQRYKKKLMQRFYDLYQEIKKETG